jgi:NADH-quinone oxidoreductase subunit L
VLYDKWYVDEVYDAVVVRPVLATSRFFARWVDQGLVDGIANGAGYASRALGWVNSRMQTGLVNGYAFMIILGALLLLAFMLG